MAKPAAPTKGNDMRDNRKAWKKGKPPAEREAEAAEKRRLRKARRSAFPEYIDSHKLVRV